jgi:hypothetical protein
MDCDTALHRAVVESWFGPALKAGGFDPDDRIALHSQVGSQPEGWWLA